MKYSVNPVKYIPDDEVVLVFVEKSGSRFITRIKIDNILLNYLFESDISLSISVEIKLHEKLIRILGFFQQYLFNFTIIAIIYVF
jgi:hypothetical protein